MQKPPDKHFWENLIAILFWLALIGLVLMVGNWEQNLQPIDH